MLYYQSVAGVPMERRVFGLDLKSGKRKDLTPRKGVNRAQFSTTYDLFVWSHSTANTPPVYEVYDRNGKLVRSLEDNATLKKAQEETATQPIEFFTFNTSD